MPPKQALLLALPLLAGPAAAHAPYLLPNDFGFDRRDHVTVEASFSEHPFVPDIVMKSDDYHAVGPDGRRIALTPVYGRDLALIEVPTDAAGTYRITSGARQGRTARAALIDGEWEFLDPRKPVPADAHAVDMQSVTRAEAYVSRGAPNQAALAPTGQGLEYQPISHPDTLHAGQAARFRILFDGVPLPDTTVEIEHGRIGYDENERLPVIQSDAQGYFTFTPARPGLYFAMTRHRVGPAAGQPARSFTYALTLSVQP